MSQASGIDDSELNDGSQGHEEKDILHSSSKEVDNNTEDLDGTEGNEVADLHDTDGNAVDDLHDADGSEVDYLDGADGNEEDDLHGTEGNEVDDLHGTDGNEVDDPHSAVAGEGDDLHANEVDDLHSTDVDEVDDLHGIGKLIQEGEQDGAVAEEEQQDSSLPPSKGVVKKEVKPKKPRKKRSSLVERPDSPTTQRIHQRLRYMIIQDACNELVKMRKVNGGPKHGDLAMIVKKYNNELGHSFVTRAVLSNKLSQKKTSSKSPKDDDSFYSAAASEQEGEEDHDSGSSMDESEEPKKRQRKVKTLSTKKKKQAVATKKKKQAVATSKKRKKVTPKKGGKRTSSSSPRKRRKIDYDSTEDEDEDDDESSDSAEDDEDELSAEDDDDESSQSSSADRVQRMIHQSIIDDAYGELLKLPGGAKKKENVEMIVEMYQELGQTFVTEAAIKKRMTGKAIQTEINPTKAKAKKSTSKKKVKAAKKRSPVKGKKAQSTSKHAKSEAYQLRQAVIRQAFNDLKALRASHGGESNYGDVPKIIKKYHEKGHTFVTREVLKHRLAREREREEKANSTKGTKKKKSKVRVEPTSEILRAIFDEADANKKLSSEVVTNVHNLDANARKEIIMQAFDELMELREQNGGAIKYGDIRTIVRKYRRDGYDFVTRGVLNYQFVLRKKPSDDQGEVNNYQPQNTRRASSSKTGKKVQKGKVSKKKTSIKASSKTKSKTTVKKKKITDRIKNKIPDFEAKVKEGTTKCAELLAQEKARLRVTGSNLKPGAFQSMISRVEKELGLPPNSINGVTVMTRVKRNNFTGECSQRTSPLKDIEPTIIQYCHRLLKIGVELEKHQVLLLTESLIRGTSHRERFIEFKKNNKLLDPDHVYGETELVVGDAYYRRFMKRNHDALALPSNLAAKRNIHQPEWCTNENLKVLYNNVYDAMVDEARVAIRLDDATYFDRDGNQVEPGDESAFGLPTHYMVTKPNNIVYINEIDVINFSVKGQNAVVGHKVVLPLELERPSTDDEDDSNIVPPTWATVLCFSSGTGIPIMCAVIFASESKISDLPYSWKYGIDITKQLKGGSTTDTDASLWSQNSGEGEAMAGGPVCYFEGKRIPCYTECSPAGAIDSEMFVDMLKYLDGFNLFDRSDGTKPFLLLDGHHCILDLPLLNYVHDHGWVLRLGLPYGLNYWQRPSPTKDNDTTAPGASSYPIVINYDGGVFGRALIESKHKYMNLKSSPNGFFQNSDIIPLINDAWSKSLGDVEHTRNIICDRGWGPLTYNILQHPKVIVTVPDTDAAEGQPEHEGNRPDDASVKKEDQASQEGGPQLSTNGLATTAEDEEVQPAQESGPLLSNDSLTTAAAEEEVRPVHEDLQEGGSLLNNDSLATAASDDTAATAADVQPKQEDN